MSARDELFRLIAGRTATTAVEAILAAGYVKVDASSDLILADLEASGVPKSEQFDALVTTQKLAAGNIEWGTDHWGDILTEPDEGHARGVVRLTKGTKMFRRVDGGPWEWVTS